MNRPLNESEVDEVLSRVAQVSLAQSQLAAGLKAAADESTNHRVSLALRHIAAEIDRGRAAADVLRDPGIQMPPHVGGLIAAATRTSRLGAALDELIEHHRQLRNQIRDVWIALAYPLIVLAITSLVLGFFMIQVVPQFETLFREFELEIPAVTKSLVQVSNGFTSLWSGFGLGTVIVVVSALALLLYLSVSGRGGATLQRTLEMAPIMGPLWAWTGAAGFLRILALLLENDVPLPDALGLAADGVRKADLRQAGRWLSQQVSGGLFLSDLVEASGCLPATSVPVLRWGERVGLMTDAAKTLSEMYSERVRIRTTWLRSALPPVIYLVVVLSLGFAIVGLFLPLYTVTQGLM